jgi:hypothetical protein
MLFEIIQKKELKNRIAMKRLLIILPILSLLVASCHKDPYADAIISPNPAWVGEDITFTNISSNTDYSEWDMGDGTSSSSFNVIHYYYDPGVYDVTLRSFGRKGGVNVASFVVEVDGSELKVIVEELNEGYLIEGASVVLFNSLDAWMDLDYNNATEEQFTNRYGECWFSDLSYQKYYVDVYYRVGNEGYVNELLGLDDPERWIETQELPGGLDHTFIAVVESVIFNDVKKSTGRPAVRAPEQQIKRKVETSPADKPIRENKISVKKERK